MKRRKFIATAGAGVAAASAFQVGFGVPVQSDRQIFEFREYTMLAGPAEERLHTFMENVAIPAHNEIGVSPLGAFTVMHGQTDPTLYVFLPYDGLEDFVASRSRLQLQSDYVAAIDPPPSRPTYVRYQSQLMRAFAGMPQVEVPKALGTEDPRIFELRIYESHNHERAKRKIEMFNRREIEIFREVDRTPIFFGETLAGARMPNLTYMVVFEDMQHRNEVGAAFGRHPGWQELRQDPYYENAISNISSILLRPTGYSQI